MPSEQHRRVMMAHQSTSSLLCLKRSSGTGFDVGPHHPWSKRTRHEEKDIYAKLAPLLLQQPQKHIRDLPPANARDLKHIERSPNKTVRIQGEECEVRFYGQLAAVILGEDDVRQLAYQGLSLNYEVRRNDLCAGFVQIAINGDFANSQRLYLDSIPQLVVIGGKPHIFRFVQSLEILMINDHPYRSIFGGAPLTVYVNGIKHSIGLSSLPLAVIPGQMNLWDMEWRENGSPSSGLSSPWSSPASSMEWPNTPSPPREEVAHKGNEKMYTSPVVNKPERFDATSSVNPHDLYAKLLCAGLVPGVSTRVPVKAKEPASKQSAKATVVSDASTIEPVKAKEPASKKSAARAGVFADLKTRDSSVIDSLYSQKTTIQCKVCGIRFPVSDREKYSAHLDWHFKMRQIEKSGRNREWFVPASNWTETAKGEMGGQPGQLTLTSSIGDVTSKTVPIQADTDSGTCPVCYEDFDQVFIGSDESWHYCSAVRIDGQVYHPQCHGDRNNVSDCVSEDEEEENKVVRVKEEHI